MEKNKSLINLIDNIFQEEGNYRFRNNSYNAIEIRYKHTLELIKNSEKENIHEFLINSFYDSSLDFLRENPTIIEKEGETIVLLIEKVKTSMDKLSQITGLNYNAKRITNVIEEYIVERIEKDDLTRGDAMGVNFFFCYYYSPNFMENHPKLAEILPKDYKSKLNENQRSKLYNLFFEQIGFWEINRSEKNNPNQLVEDYSILNNLIGKPNKDILNFFLQLEYPTLEFETERFRNLVKYIEKENPYLKSSLNRDQPMDQYIFKKYRDQRRNKI